MKKSLHIAILSYRSAPFGGGQGIYIFEISKALKEIGHKVDVTLFNPSKKWTYNIENNNSKSSNTPLFGSELTGFVYGTIVGSNYHKNLPD